MSSRFPSATSSTCLLVLSLLASSSLRVILLFLSSTLRQSRMCSASSL